MKKKLIIILAVVAALATLSVGVAAGTSRYSSSGGIDYEVSVTNLMPGQILSPIVVATHTKDNAPLFSLGQPSSAELAAMAEDADTSGLMALWSDNDEVNDLQVLTLDDGPIPPGQTAMGVVNVDGEATRLSLASMLVSTNDGFISLNGMSLVGVVDRSVRVPVYDSGSEANSENCDFIPGPPCGNHLHDDSGAEGFVHIHSGVHGGGGLTPSLHDWHNPAALITIKRKF
ncbi:MAG: spondin domain-containing protein [Chloroflexi bacterium]|nr:spondin domain-containing protein [Chloroflexota bacterium]